MKYFLLLLITINLIVINFIDLSFTQESLQQIVQKRNITSRNVRQRDRVDNNDAEADEAEDINSKKTKSEIFDKVLEGDYDTKLRPPGVLGKKATVVQISMFVRSIENIDDIQMDYRLQTTFRQEWIDPRVKYSHLLQENVTYLTLVKPKRIWRPDIFFSNEKEGFLHELMVPNLFTRIYPNGRILQSYRITLTLSCIMNLRSYPMDVQHCPIKMVSYGWSVRDLQLKWRSYKPIEMAKDFSMPRFILKNYSMETCISKTSSGIYDCLQLQLEFSRQLGFYILQIYCPTSMLVVISWVSFWLEPTATEARVSLGVTTILTIVTETYGINQSVPPASYIKSIDVWTTACEALVFSALLQFALVNYIANFQWKKQLQYISLPKSSKEAIEIMDSELGVAVPISNADKIKEHYHKKAKKLNFISQIFFPILFISFNIVYWVYYGILAENSN